MVNIFRKKDNKSLRGKIVLCLIVFSAVALSVIGNLSAQTMRESKATEMVKEHEAKTMDILSKIDIFTEEDERLKMDAAKAHYNMGNVYYQKGDYEVAAREYYQAAILIPNDPDVHYNLAYVSSENLNDFETALEHYRMYLYLKPNAPDLQYVRHKVLECELKLKSKIDSPLEDEAGHK